MGGGEPGPGGFRWSLGLAEKCGPGGWLRLSLVEKSRPGGL